MAKRRITPRDRLYITYMLGVMAQDLLEQHKNWPGIGLADPFTSPPEPITMPKKGFSKEDVQRLLAEHGVEVKATEPDTIKTLNINLSPTEVLKAMNRGLRIEVQQQLRRYYGPEMYRDH